MGMSSLRNSRRCQSLKIWNKRILGTYASRRDPKGLGLFRGMGEEAMIASRVQKNYFRPTK